jgi:hypothetical protein
MRGSYIHLGAELVSYERCNHSAVGDLGIFFGREGWKVRGSKERKHLVWGFIVWHTDSIYSLKELGGGLGL